MGEAKDRKRKRKGDNGKESEGQERKNGKVKECEQKGKLTKDEAQLF